MVSKERKRATQQKPNKNIIRADRVGDTRLHSAVSDVLVILMQLRFIRYLSQMKRLFFLELKIFLEKVIMERPFEKPRH